MANIIPPDPREQHRVFREQKMYRDIYGRNPPHWNTPKPPPVVTDEDIRLGLALAATLKAAYRDHRKGGGYLVGREKGMSTASARKGHLERSLLHAQRSGLPKDLGTAIFTLILPDG